MTQPRRAVAETPDIGLSVVARDVPAVEVARALDTLTPERGAKIGVTNPLVGTINLYQVAEWAVTHVERHDRQAQRALGEVL